MSAPHSVFGDDDADWVKQRYAQLCGYSHSRAGYNNADFWESNGPIFVPSALHVVETRVSRDTGPRRPPAPIGVARLYQATGRDQFA